MTVEISVPSILTPCSESLDDVSNFVSRHADFVAENEISVLQVEYTEAYEDYYSPRIAEYEKCFFSYRQGFALGFFVGRKHAQQTGQKLRITSDTIEKHQMISTECLGDLRQQTLAVNLRMVKKEERFGVLELSELYFQSLGSLIKGMDYQLDKDVYDKAFADALLLVMTSLEAECVRRQYFPNLWERLKDKLFI